MKTYGIELETSSIGIGTAQAALDRAGLAWECKPDGTNGVDAEAVSPILNDGTLNETLTAARALARAGATVNKQTGYHVHLGADYYGVNAIAALVHNWYTAANGIGALVAKSRLSNRYCLHSLSERDIDYWGETIRNNHINNNAVSTGRFMSLNLNSYDRHGTIEFRLHHGTLNGKKIEAWAKFCESLASFSLNGGTLSAGTGSKLLDCFEILETLTAANTLDTPTAEYLKQRATELNG